MPTLYVPHTMHLWPPTPKMNWIITCLYRPYNHPVFSTLELIGTLWLEQFYKPQTTESSCTVCCAAVYSSSPVATCVQLHCRSRGSLTVCRSTGLLSERVDRMLLCKTQVRFPASTVLPPPRRILNEPEAHPVWVDAEGRGYWLAHVSASNGTLFMFLILQPLQFSY